MKVAAANFNKDSSILSDKPVVEPVTISRNGRGHRVVRLEDFADDEMAAIVGANVPAGEYLDEELKDWKP